jgi:hypothetical protein
MSRLRKGAVIRIVKLTAVVAVLAVVAIAAYSQAASGGDVATHFKVITQYAKEKPYRLGVLGKVQSKKHECVARRKVILYFNRIDKRHRSDAGWSSRRGAIGLKGHWHAVPRHVIVKIRTKQGQSYTCAGTHFDRLGLTRLPP